MQSVSSVLKNSDRLRIIQIFHLYKIKMVVNAENEFRKIMDRKMVDFLSVDEFEEVLEHFVQLRRREGWGRFARKGEVIELKAGGKEEHLRIEERLSEEGFTDHMNTHTLGLGSKLTLLRSVSKRDVVILPAYDIEGRPIGGELGYRHLFSRPTHEEPSS